MIEFKCDNETLNNAYKIAIDDCILNVRSYKGGLLTKEEKCILAGAGYDTPWTRDTAINIWNAFALLDRQTAKRTLLSVMGKNDNGYFIDGQYWDAIIWTIGAYQYIIVSGDYEFLKIAQEAVANSLADYEKKEFDSEDGLFRGPAVYGDGIAAYPDQYTDCNSSGILEWAGNIANSSRKASAGVGIPMKALSTNCVYYQSYVLLAKMNDMLGMDYKEILDKAAALKSAINKSFWNEDRGTYDYLAYECDYQEALGISFVLLFDIADERQASLVLKNAKITEHGIACVWPSFGRYLELGGYGRHAGTIWPHAQGFWARACSKHGYTYGFEKEMFLMAQKAVRDNQFWEIYHPDTGEVYGGLQGNGNNNIHEWDSCPHQTWSATAFLSLVYYEILGAEIDNHSVTFSPSLPTGVNEAVISGVKVGNTTFDVTIIRGGMGESTARYETDRQENVIVRLTV